MASQVRCKCLAPNVHHPYVLTSYCRKDGVTATVKLCSLCMLKFSDMLEKALPIEPYDPDTESVYKNWREESPTFD